MLKLDVQRPAVHRSGAVLRVLKVKRFVCHLWLLNLGRECFCHVLTRPRALARMFLFPPNKLTVMLLNIRAVKNE